MLPMLWAGIIALAILVYVVLDGFVLGVGILFGLTRSQGIRETMMRAVAPVWDGNQTWLIIVGAGLFAVFPMIYSILLPAFYLPLSLLLVALIFRGVAFEFRHRAEGARWLWDLGFVMGSLVAAFVQGTAVGAIVTGIPVADGRFAGGAFVWLTPFAVLCGAGLAWGYMLLGASWLILKTEGATRAWAYRACPWLLGAVLVFLAIAFVYALAAELEVMRRWIERPVLFVFPLLGAFATGGLVYGTHARSDRWPFAMAATIFASAFGTFAVSFWPYMIPFSVTYQEAAAPAASLRFMFYGGVLVVLPIVIVYTGWVYWVFRGKVVDDAGYH